MTKLSDDLPTFHRKNNKIRLKTKEKIRIRAIEHFNEFGYGAVNLFELAQKIGISRGNLTYHFKTKESILEMIVEEMFQKMEEERQKSKQLPSFEDLHNEVQLYYKFQKKYTFIFLDSQVLKLPFVNQKFKEMSSKYIVGNNAAISFAIEFGNMKPEPVPGIYHNLAVTSWMLAFYWSAQQVIREEISQEDGEKMIWCLLIPHFTEKGIKAFIDFFGKAYYDGLGPSYNKDVTSFISF